VQEVTTTLQKQFLPWQIALHDPLVDQQKILLPSFLIKLELMQNSVEAMNQNGEGFRYVVYKFP
jgi:hypothetical protein